MTGPELCLDDRNLLAAAFDSCSLLPAFSGDVIE